LLLNGIATFNADDAGDFAFGGDETGAGNITEF
jgi:hypothetical protein